MKFKHPFLVITIVAITMAMISCDSNSSGTKNNTDKPKMPTKRDSFVSNKKLPKKASRLNNLPSNVKGFVQTNYPGYLIIIVVGVSLCGGGDAVDAVISKIGSPDLSLIFKPDGSFVQQQQDVPIHTAPIAIIQTLKARYSDYKTPGQIEKLTLADNTEEYLIDLSRGAKSKEVIFATNGMVICED
jgi:hypothetical protein